MVAQQTESVSHMGLLVAVCDGLWLMMDCNADLFRIACVRESVKRKAELQRGTLRFLLRRIVIGRRPIFLLDDLPIVVDPSLGRLHDVHEHVRGSLAGLRLPPADVQESRDAFRYDFLVLGIGTEMVPKTGIGMHLDDSVPWVAPGKREDQRHVDVSPVVDVHWQFQKSRNRNGFTVHHGYLVAIAGQEVGNFGSQRILIFGSSSLVSAKRW